MSTAPGHTREVRVHKAPSRKAPLSRRTWPPRLLQVVLGAWLIVTVFIWTHSRVQAFVALGAGGLTVALGLLSAKLSSLRILTALAGVWLLVASFVSPGAPLTLFNNLAVALLIIFLSFLPLGDVPLVRRRRPQPT